MTPADVKALIEKWRREADRSKLLQGLDCANDLEALLQAHAREGELQTEEDPARVATMGGGTDSPTASTD